MPKQFLCLVSGYETITFSLKSQLFSRFITGARKTDLTKGRKANCAADNEFTPSRALRSYLTFLHLHLHLHLNSLTTSYVTHCICKNEGVIDVIGVIDFKYEIEVDLLLLIIYHYQNDITGN